MAANRTFSFTAALTNTLTTNIFNPGTVTGGVNSLSGNNLFAIVKHIRILNKTAGAVTFSLYRGATGANTAGTEYIGTGVSVAANSYVDYYGLTRFDVGDFLVGGASANTSLVITLEGEIGLV